MHMDLTKPQQEQLEQLLSGAVQFDEPMSKHTTMQVGGPADAWVQPHTVEELSAIMQFAMEHDVPWCTVGRGSNLLVRDGGIRGIVLNLSKLSTLEQTDEATPAIYAEAGVRLKRLLGFCAEHGLSGVEGLEGVPGTVGGAVVMNAGTPAGTIGDAILDVTYIDHKARLVTRTAKQLDFRYRKSKIPRSATVISARLAVQKTDPEKVRAKIQQLRDKREKAQPAATPGVGSVFRNPPKSSAWSLVDEAGLRGVRIGRARVSELHTNWIVNEGGATARDIETLIRLMRDQVKEKCGVLLEAEVVVVGEEQAS